MIERCIIEVEELHRFFQEWFTGALPNTDEAFGRFTAAMDPGFTIQQLDQREVTLPNMINWLRGAHRCESEGFCIELREIRPVELPPDKVAVQYQEWHLDGEARRGRASTAVFVAAPDAPNGVHWLAVQESALPPASP